MAASTKPVIGAQKTSDSVYHFDTLDKSQFDTAKAARWVLINDHVEDLARRFAEDGQLVAAPFRRDSTGRAHFSGGRHRYYAWRKLNANPLKYGIDEALLKSDGEGGFKPFFKFRGVLTKFDVRKPLIQAISEWTGLPPSPMDKVKVAQQLRESPYNMKNSEIAALMSTNKNPVTVAEVSRYAHIWNLPLAIQNQLASMDNANMSMAMGHVLADFAEASNRQPTNGSDAPPPVTEEDLIKLGDEITRGKVTSSEVRNRLEDVRRATSDKPVKRKPAELVRVIRNFAKDGVKQCEAIVVFLDGVGDTYDLLGGLVDKPGDLLRAAGEQVRARKDKASKGVLCSNPECHKTAVPGKELCEGCEAPT